MRGKACENLVSYSVARITPAYAGKSFSTRFKPCIPRDHPRLCGEKFMRLFPCLTRWGSPPPMRGKEKQEVDENRLKGITPAYAGKSPWTHYL